MKNTTLLILIAVILIGIFAFFIFNNNTGPKIDGSVAGSGGDSKNVQKIVLSIKDYNYYPNTVYVKAGQPVSISLDDTVRGCYRTLVIPRLGLRKTFKSSSDTMDFTPEEKGTYEFSCSMRMGIGTLVVN